MPQKRSQRTHHRSLAARGLVDHSCRGWRLDQLVSGGGGNAPRTSYFVFFQLNRHWTVSDRATPSNTAKLAQTTTTAKTWKNSKQRFLMEAFCTLSVVWPFFSRTEMFSLSFYTGHGAGIMALWHFSIMVLYFDIKKHNRRDVQRNRWTLGSQVKTYNNQRNHLFHGNASSQTQLCPVPLSGTFLPPRHSSVEEQSDLAFAEDVLDRPIHHIGHIHYTTHRLKVNQTEWRGGRGGGGRGIV